MNSIDTRKGKEPEIITIKTAPKKEKTTQYNAKKHVKKSQNNPTNEDVNNKIEEKNSAGINNNNSGDDIKNEEKLESFVVVEDTNAQR